MNRSKYQKRVELAHRLRAVGVPLEIDVVAGESGLVMCQSGEELQSHAFNTKYGGAAYAVYMRITFILPGHAISSIELELPWRDPSISLLEDPKKTGNHHSEYCFPGETGYGFHRSEVINHYANVRYLRPRGKTLEGFLLWGGMNPIPESWPLRNKIPAFVIVYDQFGSTYRCSVTLYDTRTKKSLARVQRKSTRKPLFECRDPKPGRAKSQKCKTPDRELETARTR